MTKIGLASKVGAALGVSLLGLSAPAAAATTASVTIDATSSSVARVAYVGRVHVTCPAGWVGTVYDQVTQRLGGRVVTTYGQSSQINCTGSRQAATLPATAPRLLPTTMSKAFLVITGRFCSTDRATCTDLDRVGRSVTISPLSTINSGTVVRAVAGTDTTMSLTLGSPAARQGAGAVLTVPFTYVCGNWGSSIGGTVAYRNVHGQEVVESDYVQPSCDATRRHSLFVFSDAVPPAAGTTVFVQGQTSECAQFCDGIASVQAFRTMKVVSGARMILR